MNRKPDGFPIPNSNELVGNVYWGESLTVVSCDFPGLNRMLFLASSTLLMKASFIGLEPMG